MVRSLKNKQALLAQGFSWQIAGLLGADDLDLHAAIGLQTLNELLGLLLGLAALVPGDGLLALGVDPVRLDALADQVALDGFGALLRKLLVVLVGTDAAMPFGRVCQPEDIANAVRFLVSERASYITGEKINVYGGGQA